MRIIRNAAVTGLLAVLLVNLPLLPAAETDAPADWPEFHGAGRDNISPDRGLLKRWPQRGPRIIWKYSQCGKGYSGVAIAEEMIFTAGDFDDQEMLIALSMDGKLLWRAPNGKSWQKLSPGSRTTPTYHQGVLYHLNPTGRLAAYRARSGKPIWSVDLQAEFDARWGTWAMAENVVVDGDKVLCLPGGSKGAVVALDRHTGKTIWANTELKDRAAYCSPLVVTYKGVRQMITMTQKSAISVDVGTGELLWSYPHGRYGQSTTTPIFRDGYVFVTCGHSAGGALLKIDPDLRGVKQVWLKKKFDNCHGGVILLGKNLYGCGCRLGGKGFFCVDFLTGETKQTNRTLGKVSITYADGMLYCLSDKGRMSLVSVTPEQIKVVSQFDLPKLPGEGQPLCHPTVCGQRLYQRHGQQLYVYDVKAGQAKEEDVKAAARAFLKRYQARFAELEIRANLASWKAANSGRKEDFAAAAEATLAMRKFHSDADAYKRLRELRQSGAGLSPVEVRALQIAELAYRRNQLPPDLLKQMVELSAEIDRTLTTFRAELDAKRLSNNDLLEMIREADDSKRRKRAWEALKQVGSAVAPRLLKLAELRNRAARQLGFDDYWQMQIQLQEHDPRQLLAIFDELERLTRQPFSQVKVEMDRQRAERFGITPEEIMPWHYDNPFFQAAPPSDEVDLDEFYADAAKEHIVALARKFFSGIGLPVDGVLRRSDLYEREGKDQHAFCAHIDRSGDVRTLCNVKPTAHWMEVVLHELGHAVYDLHIDRDLPYNLRDPAHAFTTEGVAMLFGALAKDPTWLVASAGADEERVGRLVGVIRQQRLREQLVFARWTMVMLHFEKALYENPQRDLNALWWDYVERFQQLRRPPQRNAPDWAAKPHFTIAPVYYHNYMLGELFSAQLRHLLAELAGRKDPAAPLSISGQKRFGDFLKREVFSPGSREPWPEFVRQATGEPLTARYFAAEVERR